MQTFQDKILHAALGTYMCYEAVGSRMTDIPPPLRIDSALAGVL